MDGGYIMAGDTTFLYGIGAYLIKADHEGNEEWNMTYPFIDGQSEARSVVQTSDGGYLFTGSININNKFSQMIWLVKTDRSGYMHPGGSSEAYTVIESIDGGYTVVGTAYFTDLMTTEAWLLHVDQNGKEKWLKKFKGNGASPLAYSVNRTSDGGYIVAGNQWKYELGNLIHPWIMKTDGTGRVQWFDKFEGNNPSSVIETSDGGYVIGGTKDNSCGNEDYDFWLAKLGGSEFIDTL